MGFGSKGGVGMLAKGDMVKVGAVSTIPLPASGILLLAGLGVMALVRRWSIKLAV